MNTLLIENSLELSLSPSLFLQSRTNLSFERNMNETFPMSQKNRLKIPFKPIGFAQIEFNRWEISTSWEIGKYNHWPKFVRARYTNKYFSRL